MMKSSGPSFCPNCKFNLNSNKDSKPRRQTTLDSSLFKGKSFGIGEEPYSEDENTFTVIKTNYKLDRKKKVHEDVNRNSYFNITAMTMDSKRRLIRKPFGNCWTGQNCQNHRNTGKYVGNDFFRE